MLPGSEPLSPDKHVVLNIEGMTCASCVSAVSSALSSVDGVLQADVNLTTEQAHVQCTFCRAQDVEKGPCLVQDEALCAAVEAIGFGADVHSSVLLQRPGRGQVVLTIEGMTCASCVAAVASALQAQPGVADASVNLSTETANVDVASGTAVDDALVASLVSAVELIGFGAQEQKRSSGDSAAQQEEHFDTQQEQHARLLGGETAEGSSAQASVDSLQARQLATVAQWRKRCIIAGIFAVPNLFITMLLPMTIHSVHMALMQPAFGVPGLSWMAVVGAALATPVQFGCAIPFYKKAYKAAVNGMFGMDFLVVVGTTGEFPVVGGVHCPHTNSLAQSHTSHL